METSTAYFEDTDSSRNKQTHSNNTANNFTEEYTSVTEYQTNSMTEKPQRYIENYPAHTKAIFVLIGVIALFSSAFAIIVLRRTKKIPYAGKFLTTGLLAFDLMYITSITIRKLIQNPLYNTSLNVFSTTVLQLAYVSVALMSIERFLMFYRPMKYMRFCTEKMVQYIAYTIWILTVTIFQTVRYGFCYLAYQSNLVFEEAGLCNQIVTIHYTGLVLIVLITSVTCYWNIFNIVRNQLRKSENKHISFASTAGTLRTYKSTSLVLVYLLVILCTSVTYGIIIVFIRYANLEVNVVRLSLETISMINCLLDPFLYVLWFKESQMELCLLFAPFSKKLQDKATQLKYEVFDIVTTESPVVNQYPMV